MALADDNEPDYGTFGVRAQRTADPVTPPAIDRQRIYLGNGGNISPATKGRAKASGGATVNTTKPGGFAARQKTLRKG